ncbi:hypothetical protein BpHYR1_041731 [Brachionus plicatilis]|uniref:Uncharacterized protein n=1 Tax=Brachionus plicatilis TaxID=10195 RepID=A0A3M7S7A1_BRAPC|nr:hypothetical protein BpHYR1_041731 [Brachionus plicatilis]
MCLNVSNDTIAKHNEVLELHVKENIALKRKTSRIPKAPQHRSSRKQEIKVKARKVPQVWMKRIFVFHLHVQISDLILSSTNIPSMSNEL